MEKKGSRSVGLQPAAADLKKNQDGTGGKLWPRGGRRREPSGGTFPARAETSRKCGGAKPWGPGGPKQPRSRGSYHGAHGRREEAGVEEEELLPEVGSVIAKGSKKQSLNHLLNFQLAPHLGQSGGASAHKILHHNRWSNYSGRHKYNKEQFIQANCQFIVKSSGDYKIYLNNPDSLVDWDLIEQVNVRVVELPSCPICLYPPVAAKITRCGHIYCWSCVLHYLALSDKASGKCPICYEVIHKQDLKSVVTIPFSQYNTEETITLKLMKKKRGSLMAFPVDESMEEIEGPHSMSNANASIYCKLLTADKGDVLNIIERERGELCLQLMEDENNPEKCFIDQAIAQLDERENFVLGQIEANLVARGNSKVENVQRLLDDKNSLGINRRLDDNILRNNQLGNNLTELNYEENYFIGSNVTENNVTGNNFTENYSKEHKPKTNLTEINTAEENMRNTEDEKVENENIGKFESRRRFESTSSECGSCSSDPRQPSKFFYFYQASDGQHIYLHTVNAKMLEHSFGSLEFCPKTISGRILEKEVFSMTEDFRKRNRCLQHLPVTCQFELVEIQMNHSIVSKETISTFKEQLQQRQKRRQKRARDEKRREKKITEEENLKMGKFPEANISLESHLQFPTFEEIKSEEFGENFGPFLSQNEGASSGGNLDSGPSFAKMLSTASRKKTSFNPPTVNKSPQTVKFVNVTGAEVKSVFKKRGQCRESDDEALCEDYVPAPSYSRSLNDDLEIALQKIALKEPEDETKNSQGGNGKKKKKNKQKILFSTHMPYVN